MVVNGVGLRFVFYGGGGAAEGEGVDARRLGSFRCAVQILSGDI